MIVYEVSFVPVLLGSEHMEKFPLYENKETGQKYYLLTYREIYNNKEYLSICMSSDIRCLSEILTCDECKEWYFEKMLATLKKRKKIEISL